MNTRSKGLFVEGVRLAGAFEHQTPGLIPTVGLFRTSYPPIEPLLNRRRRAGRSMFYQLLSMRLGICAAYFFLFGQMFYSEKVIIVPPGYPTQRAKFPSPLSDQSLWRRRCGCEVMLSRLV